MEAPGFVCSSPPPPPTCIAHTPQPFIPFPSPPRTTPTPLLPITHHPLTSLCLSTHPSPLPSQPPKTKTPTPQQASAWRELEAPKLAPWVSPPDVARRAQRLREMEAARQRCHGVTAPRMREQVGQEGGVTTSCQENAGSKGEGKHGAAMASPSCVVPPSLLWCCMPGAPHCSACLRTSRPPQTPKTLCAAPAEGSRRARRYSRLETSAWSMPAACRRSSLL